MEEEEILQDKWVALFVNYIDSKKSFNSTVFPYILTQISTDEAKGLEYIERKKEVQGLKKSGKNLKWAMPNFLIW